MNPSEDGELLFAVDEQYLLSAVKTIGTDDGLILDDIADVLRITGLTQANGDAYPTLSTSGQALYRAAFVFSDTAATRRLLGQALRALLPIQVLAQELGNSPAIPEDGAVNLLALHRVVRPSFSADEARSTFRWLNDLGVVAYSRQKKTVRFIPDDPGAAKAGEIDSLSAMISPRTPYSNVARLRKVLRSRSGIVTWADPHFGARAFEELVDELDPRKVTELRIISKGAENVVTPKSFKDYQRFVEEMALGGIPVEWRVDSPGRDWHDRFLVDENGSFNMPPINNLFQNQYSEILPSDKVPPTDEWWKRSTPRTS